jgi:Contractile injection system tube protein
MSDNNLKIIPYTKPKGAKKNEYNEGEAFIVDFNPNTFTINNKIEYKQPKTKGKEGGDPVFERIPPLEFSIEFTIDGTGVATQSLTEKQKNDYKSKKHDYVKTRIKELRGITGCQINGDIHRPNYLAVNWGTFHIECVLASLNITYNLFDDQGSPLRAKVNCSFTERIGQDKEGRQSALESPDLTKYRPLVAGDVLPLIIKNNYDDSAYYIQVAKANKLKNFRRLIPGTTLVLPPMKESDE